MRSTKSRYYGEAAMYAAFLKEQGGTNSAALKRLRQQLRRTMEEDLTPTQRQALMLYYGEELTMRQVAERMGTCVSNTWRTVHRAQDKLRYYMRQINPLG